MNYKQQQNLKTQKGRKNYRIWIPISILGIIFALFVFLTLWSVAHLTSFQSFLTTQGYQYSSAGYFLDNIAISIFNAFLALTWKILIIPFSFVLSKTQIIIRFLSGSEIISSFLFDNTDVSTPSKWYGWFLVASFSFLTLMIIVKMLIITVFKANEQSKALSNSLRNLALALMVIPLIPLIFFGLNTIISTLIEIVFKISNIENQDVALLIFNSSFSKGMKNWTSIPVQPFFTGWTEFNPLMCIFATGFLAWIFMVSIIKLFWIIGELFVYFITSPLAIFSSFADEGKRVNQWKELVVSRFFNYWIIYLMYGVYLALQPILLKLTLQIPDKTASGLLFILGSIAFAFLIPQGAIILNYLFDNVKGTNENVSNYMGMKISKGMMFNPLRFGWKVSKAGGNALGTTIGNNLAIAKASKQLGKSFAETKALNKQARKFNENSIVQNLSRYDKAKKAEGNSRAINLINRKKLVKDLSKENEKIIRIPSNLKTTANQPYLNPDKKWLEEQINKALKEGSEKNGK